MGKKISLNNISSAVNKSVKNNSIKGKINKGGGLGNIIKSQFKKEYYIFTGVMWLTVANTVGLIVLYILL